MTLEPINIEKVISPQSIYEVIISQSNKFCEYGLLPNFIQEISSKTRKAQNEEYIDYMNRLKREFDADKYMTFDEARKITFGFLYRTKNYMAFERASTVMQALKHNFVRVKRFIDSLNIRDLKTFDLANPQIQFIINYVKTEIQRLRNGHRAIGLIIEGKTGIAKTDLMWAICKELKIIFNYMNRKMNFSDKRYDDQEAEIDIWDDLRASYYNEHELFESVFGGQAGFIVETAKHEQDRTIEKRKLNIFICNPHNSYKEYFEKRHNDMEYLLGRPNVIFMKLDDKLLFKKVEEIKKGKKK